MSMKGLHSLGFVVGCVAVTALAAQGADWRQWGGTNCRNMVSSERGLVDRFVPTKGTGAEQAKSGENVKWTARMGAFAYGNPTVADGRVFVGTDAQTLSGDKRFRFSRGGLIKCLDEGTGRVLWQLPVPVRKSLPAGALFTHQHLGICSSPLIDGCRAYVVTSAAEIICLDVKGQADGNDGPFVDEGRYMAGEGGEAVQVEARDGDIIWRFDLIEGAGICPHDAASCSILMVGDVLYTSTSNGVDRPHKQMIRPLAPSLIALDKRTGRLVAGDDEKIGRRMWHCQWSSPSSGVVNGRELVFVGGGDGVCYAFEALKEVPAERVYLKKVWSYDCNPAEYRYENGKEIPYYRGDKRKSNSTNRNDGKYLGPSQIIATPVLWEGRIYVAIGQDPAHGRGKGLLHCVDATKTGDITESGKVWTYDGLDRSMATAAVSQGLVYINDVAGRLHCVDAATGECYRVHDTGEETWGGVLIADGKMYFGNKRNVYIVAEGRELKVLCVQRVSSPVFSTPVAANGVVYVASNRYLWALARD